jgi:hypothetical protein
MTFDPASLQKLCHLLNPVRERYGFEFTMERWAELVLGDDLHPGNANRSVEPIDNETELVAHILRVLPEAVNLTEDEPIRGRGRPRVDFERYAALLLAAIFHEYTRHKPTRITRWDARPTDRANTFDRDKTSTFYRFATACFQVIGLKASEDAFRETTERWERSRDFFKRSVQKQLWGGLPAFGKRSSAPEFAFNTKPLRPRIKLPKKKFKSAKKGRSVRKKREAAERRKRSREFFKRSVQKQRRGRVPAFGKRSSDREFASNTKPQRPRIKSLKKAQIAKKRWPTHKKRRKIRPL